MKQKNSPGRKNIRRINALERLECSLETLKKNKTNTEDIEGDKKFKEKIKTMKTIISNTEAKILNQDIAIEIKTKIYRGTIN